MPECTFTDIKIFLKNIETWSITKRKDDFKNKFN